MLLAFTEAPEFIARNAPVVNARLWDIDETAGSVARLYLGGEGHAPTLADLTNDTLALKAGTLTLLQAANNVAASTEFTSTYGSVNNAQFVDQLYLNLLEHAASGAEQTNASGDSLGEVLLSLTQSQEYQLKVIGQIDQGIEFT